MEERPLEAAWGEELAAQVQPELPIQGTVLNPVESAWVFHSRPGAVRPEDLASAMPPGE